MSVILYKLLLTPIAQGYVCSNIFQHTSLEDLPRFACMTADEEV